MKKSVETEIVDYCYRIIIKIGFYNDIASYLVSEQ
jgi:hypothetical protein